MEDSTKYAKDDNDMLASEESNPKLFNFTESLSSCLQKFWVFYGRATRAEFWYIQPIFVFLYLIIAIVLSVIEDLAPLYSFAVPESSNSYNSGYSYNNSYSFDRGNSYSGKYKIYPILEIVFYVVLAIYAIIFIADSALTTRRLHDIGRSGFMQFLYVVPFLIGVSLIVLLYFIKRNYFVFYSNFGIYDIIILVVCSIPIIILKLYLIVLYCSPSEPRENRFGKVRTALIKSK